MQQSNTVKKESLWRIFWEFFKIGAMTFGGGYALITVMQHRLIKGLKWTTDGEMLDMLVIAESTPGVIAVNTATSIGYRLRGTVGAIIATLGVVLPSFVIIIALSFAVSALSGNKWYNAAFSGVQVGALLLVVKAFISMSAQLEKNLFSGLVLICTFLAATFTSVNVAVLLIAGFMLGIVFRRDNSGFVAIEAES